MDSERSRIDLEGRYVSDGLTRVERRALDVIETHPDARFERTRDVFQIVLRDTEDIVLLVTREALEIRLPTIEWTQGSHGPVSVSRLWKRIPWEKKGLDLNGLLREARQVREAEYTPCKYCQQRFPPERRLDDVCHGCAERHEGIVF